MECDLLFTYLLIHLFIYFNFIKAYSYKVALNLRRDFRLTKKDFKTMEMFRSLTECWFHSEVTVKL